MQKYLAKLEWNAKVCTSFFPFWAIPFTFYMFYLSLYLKEAGVTDLQIGNIMVASNVAALLSSFIASPLVDRLGRKWATLLFDLLSSVLPTFLFLLWPVYEVALAAMALTGLNRVMSVGYYLLMIEDSSEESSVVSVNLFNLILVATGLLTPIAGVFVVHLGVIRTEQVLLVLAAFSMTSQTLLRHGLIHETPTGLVVKQKSKDGGRFWTFSRFFDVYKQVFYATRHDPVVLRAMGINAIIYVYFTLGTTSSLLFTPFFIDFV
ncbi:MAG: MFS transporter, partial [Sphaerochaetaceae bacterium]